MKIALLNTDPNILDWFSKYYPNITACEKANDAFCSAEVMIILAYYKVKGDNFQIFSLWEKYLRIKHSRKRLIVLGWSSFRSPNYLEVGNMPEDLAEWLEETAPASRKPNYPALPDKNIVDALGKFLHSHGERAIQKLMGKIQTLLRRIERPLSQNTHRDSIIEMEEMQESIFLMNQLKSTWDDRMPFFELMPQYREFCGFEQIWESWEYLRNYTRPITPKLSLQLGQFAKDPISEMVRFYKLEA